MNVHTLTFHPWAFQKTVPHERTDSKWLESIKKIFQQLTVLIYHQILRTNIARDVSQLERGVDIFSSRQVWLTSIVLSTECWQRVIVDCRSRVSSQPPASSQENTSPSSISSSPNHTATFTATQRIWQVQLISKCLMLLLYICRYALYDVHIKCKIEFFYISWLTQM